MKMFLVSANITVRRYMQDNHENIADMRIVMAPTKTEAREKYEAYWEKQNEAYDVSFWVDISAVNEAIV